MLIKGQHILTYYLLDDGWYSLFLIASVPSIKRVENRKLIMILIALNEKGLDLGSSPPHHVKLFLKSPNNL